MMRILLIFLISIYQCAYADTIRSYMGIANQIPQMEVKADPQAQAWARSAHHVLAITCESIAETMIQANEAAKAQGSPIFCLPPGVQLSSLQLNDLIQQTYKEMTGQQNDKDTMTVSQIAWIGVAKQYPCKNNVAHQEMAQVAAAWGGQK
jgi:uncharacterized protein YecT (DUF1311 family)